MRGFLAMAALALSVSATTSALAQSYTEEVVPNNDTCYRVMYKKQVDLVNPQGVLQQPSSNEFRSNIIYQHGGVARNVYNPAIYLETRTVVSPEYYSMRPTGCPRRLR
ncbi:hypothetical protein [Methylobacterium soli]|uniref:Uncharacterized protein n=1 Tax=Methylobacterium soli TaxID=553447 RepID=A0A6L3T2X4_9HYPH|nr:hypothetical protein [Methylobacterium soli]KAB1079287.1 hypothetical protein F6X53_10730 [Methylobacterium soli]GJE45208.1 hypothetical protein AEGHOMDF_4402 [Methylobacterium soli]